MDFLKDFKLNIQSSAAIIQIVSHETLRIRASCVRVSSELKRDLYIWNGPQGLRRFDTKNHTFGDSENRDQPHEVLEWLQEQSSADDHQDFILLLEDFHHYLTAHDHALISRLRAFSIAVASREVSGCTVVLSQPVTLLPVELEKETQVMEMTLPEVEDLRKIMLQAKDRYDIHDRDFSDSSDLLDAALGLSTSEAQLAFSKVACQYKRLSKLEIPHVLSLIHI